MKLSVIFEMALKNLWRHKSRMILTVSGVTIGVGAIIFLVSLGYGLEKLVTKQISSFNAFTVLDVPSSGGSNTLKINDELGEKIKRFGHINVITTVCNLAGRIKKEDQDSTAETVIISANNDYWQLAEVNPSEGSLPYNDDEIMLNDPVINMIGEEKDAIIGKEIVLSILVSGDLINDQTEGKTIEDKNYKVVGVLVDEESPIVYTNINTLKENGVVNYTSMKIQIDNVDNVGTVREQIDGLGFSTEYVGDTLDEISNVFVLFRVILAGFGLVALVVAALGTFNTLTISLMERTREVGLFKSLGMKKNSIYKLFLIEALIIGVLGGVLGLVLGYATSLGIDLIISVLAKRSGAEVISLFSTPFSFSLMVALFSIVVGFLTGWYPSKRAVKIDPLDAMRYE